MFFNLRWKQAECSIKLITSNLRGSKDVNINKKMHAIVEEILTRFTSDPKNKMSVMKNVNK
jgi:hypothetical protein